MSGGPSRLCNNAVGLTWQTKMPTRHTKGLVAASLLLLELGLLWVESQTSYGDEFSIDLCGCHYGMRPEPHTTRSASGRL